MAQLKLCEFGILAGTMFWLSGCGLITGDGDGTVAHGGALCPEGSAGGPELSVLTLGQAASSFPRPVEGYDGPAVVEQSSAEGLVLYLRRFDTMSGAGRAGTTPDPSRVGIRSFAPLPVFTRGAKLWLHRGLAGDSLRDRQNGTLLLGRLDSWLPNADAEPVTLGALEPVCTRAEEDSCTIGRRMTYYSVEVNGDTPVVVSTAQHATLTLNATEYDLWLNAAERESDFGSAHCEDSGGPNDHRMHVAADILPRNPEAALANVEGGGELPDCVVGDTPPIEATVTVSGDPPNSNRYEGLVRYGGKEAGELLFEFVERTITVRLAVPAEVMPEPAPDATLWFATPGGNAFAFRASQGGELLLAHVSSADAPTARDFSPELGQLLGVSVAVESSCVTSALTKWPYQPVLVELHDLVFGTTPPVRVRSGTSERIVLDGKAYDVRAAAVGKGLELTVLPVR